MPDLHPFTRVVEEIVQPQSTAGSALTTILLRVPFAATVTAVEYIPVATITGAATNNRAVAVVNKGGNGAGTTTIASKTYASGVNATAAVSDTVTLSATPANLVVAAGDVLQWQSTANGTGLADPGGLVRVSLSRNDF